MNNKSSRKSDTKTYKAPTREKRTVKSEVFNEYRMLPPQNNDYGRYTQAQFGNVITSRIKSPTADIAKTIAPILAQLKVQKSEIDALKKQLAQMQVSQKADENTYHVPQSLAELRPRRSPPAGMTAMQAIMGKLDVEETTEELLAQLKALD